jgi:hypothetical protein
MNKALKKSGVELICNIIDNYKHLTSNSDNIISIEINSDQNETQCKLKIIEFKFCNISGKHRYEEVFNIGFINFR